MIPIWRSEAKLLTKCRLAKVGLVNKEPGSCEFVNVFFIVVFFWQMFFLPDEFLERMELAVFGWLQAANETHWALGPGEGLIKL